MGGSYQEAPVEANIDSLIQQNLMMLENSYKMTQFNNVYYNCITNNSQAQHPSQVVLQPDQEFIEQVYPLDQGYYYQEPPRRSSREENKTNWMHPQKVLDLYYDQLTPYERNEIFSYSKIYFVGSKAAGKKISGTFSMESNYGYDDSEGGYTFITHDHVAYRYINRNCFYY